MGIATGNYDFWVHGIGAIVETILPSTQQTITRDGRYGTIIEQNAGTYNWCHFVIPTPTVWDDNGLDYRDMWLKAETNENAQVEQIHVYDGERNVVRINYAKNPLRGLINHSINLPDHQVFNGMIVCVQLRFLDGEIRGKAILKGVGVRFHT